VATSWRVEFGAPCRGSQRIGRAGRAREGSNPYSSGVIGKSLIFRANFGVWLLAVTGALGNDHAFEAATAEEFAGSRSAVATSPDAGGTKDIALLSPEGAVGWARGGCLGLRRLSCGFDLGVSKKSVGGVGATSSVRPKKPSRNAVCCDWLGPCCRDSIGLAVWLRIIWSILLAGGEPPPRCAWTEGAAMQFTKATVAAIARRMHSGFEQTFIEIAYDLLARARKAGRRTVASQRFEQLGLPKDAARASSPSPVNLVRREGCDRIGKKGCA
jgi:hypothetical protein